LLEKAMKYNGAGNPLERHKLVLCVDIKTVH
jgi:hypothetical protein